MRKIKSKTSKEMFEIIQRNVEGLTHDIKTLEVMAKKFLDAALEVRSLKQSLDNMKIRMDYSFKCKFHETKCEHICKMNELIKLDKEN